LIGQFRDLNSEVKFHKDFISCGRLTITNDFFRKNQEKQLKNPSLNGTIELLGTEQTRDFALGTDGMLRFKDRPYVSTNDELKRMNLDEGHKSHLSLHQCMTKMYKGLKELFR